MNICMLLGFEEPEMHVKLLVVCPTAGFHVKLFGAPAALAV